MHDLIVMLRVPLGDRLVFDGASGIRLRPVRYTVATGSLPTLLAQACGTRGKATVAVTTSLVIEHVKCDLSGVTISIDGGGGAVVPDTPGQSVAALDVGPHNEGLVLAVDGVSRDLTITVTP